jgi:hypothetical protein
MVSLRALGSKVYGFRPSRGLRVFKGGKILSTPSFTGEVNPSAPCRNILRHIKNHFNVWTNIFRKPNSFTSPSSS